MKEDGRPDPDALLARVQEDEAHRTRGRLKLFFGAAPGVGKTFTMLEAARLRRADGTDVVVGVVETHGRAETARMAEGLEVLPRRQIDYHGATLPEFDLDAALARHPALVLVDELAHTNAPGSRHEKRWQDVEELLDAGIDVYTTLNVQHVESLNDVVAQITGITVRETVPDQVVEAADEIELVDVSPDVLIQRLKEGHVYVPEQATRALDQFFRKGNLIALRELALRKTASRVDRELQGYMRQQGIRETWPANERIVVCIGPSSGSARAIRAARRMAERVEADWVAVAVDPSSGQRFSEEDRDAITEHLRLAESLGGRTVMLVGASVADEILAYARANNVTRLVVGKPAGRRWWRRLLRGSLVDALVRGSGAVDVYVIAGDDEAEAARAAPLPRRPAPPPTEYLRAAAVVAIATVVGLVLRGLLSTTDQAMLYIAAVAYVGSRSRQRPALVASIFAIAAFDFCFVPPFFTFAVSDANYVLTFVMMLGVAAIVSRLTGRIREQAEGSREREQRSAALYGLSRELASAREPAEVTAAAERHIASAFGAGVSFLLPDASGRLAAEDGVARWVFEHGQLAGLGTQTLPASPALYLPLVASGDTLGVARVVPRDALDVEDPVRRQLLETFVGQAAVSLERALLVARNQETRLEMEAERLRTSLLSSLSHDLRTPLGGIEGAASSLLERGEALSPSGRRELARTVLEESRRMTRLVANLLDMIRVESGALAVQKEWQPLEEVVGVALIRLDERLAGRPVAVSLPGDLPLVPIDGILIEQVLINLLENALKHAPGDSPIEIAATAAPGSVVVSVADHGPGIPPGEEERIFEKFHRSRGAGSTPGVGLGLTICRGIIMAHGGRIWAENRAEGGAIFRFTLPIVGVPPALAPDEMDAAVGRAP